MIVLTISPAGTIEKMLLPDGAGTLEIRACLVGKYTYHISVLGVPLVAAFAQADPQKRPLKESVVIKPNTIIVTFSNGNLQRRSHFQLAIMTRAYECPTPLPVSDKTKRKFRF